MRFAAETLAPEAIAGASRRCAPHGFAFAGHTSASWSTSPLAGFMPAGKLRSMVTIPVDSAHAGNATTRRPSEASP